MKISTFIFKANLCAVYTHNIELVILRSNLVEVVIDLQEKKSKKGIDGIEEERLYEIFLLFLQTTAGKVFYLLNFLSIFDDFSNCTAISLKTAQPTLEKH